MVKQIFIINGSGGSGKDTFVSLVSKYIPTMNFSSVDKVKEVARMIGWDGRKTEKDRKFLSDLKLLCTDYNDMPLESMRSKVEEFLKGNYYELLFLHIRECEEIKKAKNAFGAKVVLVKRDSIEHITSNMADANVFNYDYDVVVDNNMGLDELKHKAFRFVEDFLNGKLNNKY